MDVRLYGRSLGHGSHVVVTDGFASVLSERATVHRVALDDDSLEEHPPGGALSDWAWFTGPLNRVQIMHQNARHRRRVVMVTPNSDRIPPRLLGAVASAATDLMSPSEWAVDVVKSELAALQIEIPVWLAPHGIGAEFTVRPAARERLRQVYRQGGFHLLHFASSERERKGTRELLRAWQLADLPGGASLGMVLDAEAEMAIRHWMIEEDVKLSRVWLGRRLDRDAENMADTYSLAHVVCQPSRGEGFGLCPLEARASGVPVIATACTGHSAHMPAQSQDGVIVVPHGPPAPIDDLTGASAPTVSVDELARVLWQAYADWEALSEAAVAAAPRIAAQWQWRAQLGPVIEKMFQE